MKKTDYISIGGHVALGIGLLELQNKNNQNETYRKSIIGLIWTLQNNKVKIDEHKSIADLIAMMAQGTLEIELPPMNKENIDKDMEDSVVREEAAMQSV